MVVSAGKVTDLQRVGILSSLAEFSICYSSSFYLLLLSISNLFSFSSLYSRIPPAVQGLMANYIQQKMNHRVYLPNRSQYVVVAIFDQRQLSGTEDQGYVFIVEIELLGARLRLPVNLAQQILVQISKEQRLVCSCH